MAETWIIHRLRSTFLRENTMLFVLRLLREREMSEWELLSALDSGYGLTPSSKEFRKISGILAGGGYARVEVSEKARTLRITAAGTTLLRRLEEEYAAIARGCDASGRPVLTR